MEYDYNGLRLTKGNRKYYWQGETLKAECWGENYIYYYYDESGVSGMCYNGTEYFYRKNVSGDIIAIYDENGNEVCRYEYDAWGNHTISGSNISLGNINPFRYRGYYYDTEFGLYYLQSRYYDSEVGRFISADDVSYLAPDSIFGLNLYAYCNNNPVMYTDPGGRFVLTTSMIVGLIIGAVIGAVAGGYYVGDKAAEAGATGWELFGWTLLGVVGGGIIGGAIGLAAGWAAPAIGGMLSGSLALAGGGTAYSSVAAVAGLGLIATNVMFAKIDMHGEPNSFVENGDSFGEYDANGNLKYRTDTGHSHFIKELQQFCQPHTHHFNWDYIKGAWRVIKKWITL